MATTKEISDRFYIVAKAQHDELLKNVDNPEEFQFTKTSDDFFADLQNGIAKQYENYPSKVQEDIRKSIWKQLAKDSLNAQQHNVMANDGNLNTSFLQSVSETAINTLKQTLPPERFEAKAENELTTNENKKEIDFSNPEEKEAYFTHLFDEYSNLKTFDEKLKFFNENFYDISHLTKEEQKQVLNAYEIGNENAQMYKKILVEHPEASDEEIQKLYDECLEKKSKKTETSFDDLKKCDNYLNLLEQVSLLPDGLKKDELIKKLSDLGKDLKTSKEKETELINKITSKSNEFKENPILTGFEENQLTEDSILPDTEGNNLIEDSILPDTEGNDLTEDFILPDTEENELTEDSVLPEVKDFILPGVEKNELDNSFTHDDSNNLSLQNGDIPIPENMKFNSFGLNINDLPEQSNNTIGKELAIIPEKNRFSKFLESVTSKIKNSKLFNKFFKKQITKPPNENSSEIKASENGVSNNTKKNSANFIDSLTTDAPSYIQQHQNSQIWQEAQKQKQNDSSVIQVDREENNLNV